MRLRSLCTPGMVIAISFPSLSLLHAEPDDPDFALQWALRNAGQEIAGQSGEYGADVNAIEAWALFDGAPNVVVAIIGRGVYPHPEFADRLLEGQATIGDPYNTLDTCPHDTHLAGIIAAATGNGEGVAGLHGTSSILPVRVLDGCAVGTEQTVAEGIIWAVDQGADVILAAVSFFDGTQSLADAVAYAVAHDVVIVAPAGSAGNHEVAFPAAFDSCLAVTATTNRDDVSDASNSGVEVDLAAPGKDIWSTWVEGGYGFQPPARDTASAAAFVAGAAALIRSFSPQLSAAEVGRVLLDSADDLGEVGWDSRSGFGRVNLRRALEMAAPPAIRFEHVGPLPARIVPEEPTSLEVRLSSVGEAIVQGSEALWHRSGSTAFSRSALAPLGGDRYLAQLPAVSCDDTLEYFLSAIGDGGTIVTDPLDAPSAVHQAWSRRVTVLVEDGFEQDSGWETVVEGGASTRGAWARVVPEPTLGQPPYDRSPDSGRHCFVTGQLQSVPDAVVDVDGGPVRLVSPVFAVGHHDVEVSYARWFHWSGAGAEDFLFVEFSRNGGSTWHEVETVASTTSWVVNSFRLSEFPGVQGDSLRVRFSTSDEPNDSLTEAAVDEFRVLVLACARRAGDVNDDGVVDHLDYERWPTCLTGPADASISGECGVFDFGHDGHVDLADFQAFQGLFETP